MANKHRANKPEVAITDQTDEWLRFSLRHKSHPFLKRDVIYALSPELIASIGKRLPGFFSRADLAFEKDLAATVDFAFFNRRSLGSLARSPAHIETDRRAAASAAKIDFLLWERPGEDNDFDVKEAKEKHLARETGQHKTESGYVGWLICNSMYRDEVNELKRVWADEIGQFGRFPQIPIWPFTSNDMNADFSEQLVYHFFEFYLGWGLDSLVTWEWPHPMRAEMATTIRERQFSFKVADLLPGQTEIRIPQAENGIRGINLRLEQAGAQAFVPWHMLQGNRLCLDSLAAELRCNDVPQHLKNWVDGRFPDGANGFGSMRLEFLAWIHRFLNLALLARYREKCDGKLEFIDKALADARSKSSAPTKARPVSTETVRQVRMQLQVRVLPNSPRTAMPRNSHLLRQAVPKAFPSDESHSPISKPRSKPRNA